MPQLVIITGPLAAGKNTAANSVAQALRSKDRTVVIADVDDVAAMVAEPGQRPDEIATVVVSALGVA